MADSVNRIVPPSVSVEHSTALGREREKRNRHQAQKQKPERPAAAGADPAENDAIPTQKEPSTQEEKDKGKNLDINV
jgi:hypothetical protein